MTQEQLEKQALSLARRENNLILRRQKVNLQSREMNKVAREINLKKSYQEMIEKNAQPFKGKIKPIKVSSTKKGAIGYYAIGDDQFGGHQEQADHIRKSIRAIFSDAKKHGFIRVVIIHGGDNIDGSNRASGIVYHKTMVVDQAIEYTRIMNEELNMHSKEFKIDFYMTTVDNHAELRMGNTPAGAQPDNNALKWIAEGMKMNATTNPNITVIAKPIFYGEVLPGGFIMAMAHGNLQVVKNAKRFFQFVDARAFLLRAHTHHGEFMQEVQFDSVTMPSIKKHIDEYEKGGGWASYDLANQRYYRRSQFLRLEFIIEKESGKTRLKSLEMIDVK